MVDIKQTKFHKVFPAELKRDTLIVSPGGDAVSFRDTDINRELNTLQRLIEQPDVSNLIIDLGSSDYFGSIIIGAINNMGLKAKEAGGRIAICNSSPDMLGILKVMNLDTLWTHYDTKKEAIRALKE